MTVARMLMAAVCALMAGIAVDNARAVDTCGGIACQKSRLAVAAAVR